MMKVFFDSSSFAKRFVEEEGSNAVESLCKRATALGLSTICLPEIISALNRRRRERQITIVQYGQAKRRLLEDIRDADIVQLTPVVIGTSIRILESSAIRAMDALHVACALEWEADIFATSDERQLHAAKRAGLKTQFM